MQKIMLSLLTVTQLVVLSGTTANAAPADWKKSSKEAASLISQRQAGPAAAKIIEALGALKNASVPENDPEAEKLFSETYADTMMRLSLANDYKSGDILGRWATSVSESKFGQTSPLSYLANTVFRAWVLNQDKNQFTANRGAENQKCLAKLQDISKRQTPEQKAQCQKLMVYSQRSALKMSSETMQHALDTIKNASANRRLRSNR